MRTLPFGWTGRPVAIIGQGTWQMEKDDRAATIRSIQRGLDLGMTHIDTAEMYGSGAAERLVGEAIAGRRDEVFLASKVLPHNASLQGTLRACEQSLKRLGTDRLDLYLLHWPGAIPLEETLDAFERLVQDGKIRYWGLSNFDVDDLERALRIAGEERIACNQVLYHLEERAIEHALLPWCSAHQIPVVAYSPFGSGGFPSPDSRAGKQLGTIAAAHGATPRQVALAFLGRHPDVFTIPKASQPAHVEDNARAAAVMLSDDDIRHLEVAFPLGMRPASLPMI
ncbi:aldo/keto reductase [Chondromyces crocatus]|nr:aldo/keto reductase [Chondromyces crocatus]